MRRGTREEIMAMGVKHGAKLYDNRWNYIYKEAYFSYLRAPPPGNPETSYKSQKPGKIREAGNLCPF